MKYWKGLLYQEIEGSAFIPGKDEAVFYRVQKACNVYYFSNSWKIYSGKWFL